MNHDKLKTLAQEAAKMIKIGADKEIYGADVSVILISTVTDAVLG